MAPPSYAPGTQPCSHLTLTRGATLLVKQLSRLKDLASGSAPACEYCALAYSSPQATFQDSGLHGTNYPFRLALSQEAPVPCFPRCCSTRLVHKCATPTRDKPLPRVSSLCAQRRARFRGVGCHRPGLAFLLQYRDQLCGVMFTPPTKCWLHPWLSLTSHKSFGSLSKESLYYCKFR